MEVKITSGADLQGLRELVFSHPGITAVQNAAEPILLIKPFVHQFTVTIKPDVPPGLYEVRAIGTHGISNARVFVVGDLPEQIEKRPNQTWEQASELSVGSVVNATVDNQSRHYFKFTAKKGQRLFIDGQAKRIDSRLDVTLVLYDQEGRELQQNRSARRRDPLIDFLVPSDATYWIKVYDSLYGGGVEYFYRLNVSTRPYVDFIFPPAGRPGTTSTYTLYGRNMRGSTLASDVAIEGSSLEKLAVQIHMPDLHHTTRPPDPWGRPAETTWDAMMYQLDTPQGGSNPVYIGYATAPVVIEREPNNKPIEANKVDVPCEIAGRFHIPRPQGENDISDARNVDMDWFTFDAKRGDVYHIEVYSHQLGLPTDPFLLIQQVKTNEEGKPAIKDLAQIDDPSGTAPGARDNSGIIMMDRGPQGVINDPAYRFAVPEDGTYRVLVHDLNSMARDDLVYRLAIRTQQADFRLVALNYPWSTNPQALLLRQGGIDMIKVFAYRSDGFDGAIDVRLAYLPPGISCEGATIPSGASSTVLVLRAADDAQNWFGHIRVIGKAKIGDVEVVREARCAQLPGRTVDGESRTYRMSGNLALAVLAGWPVPFTVELTKPLIKFRTGKVEVPVKVNRREGFKEKMTVGIDGTSYIKPSAVTIDGDKTEGKIQLDIQPEAATSIYELPLTAEAEVHFPRAAESAAVAEAKQRIERIASDATAASKRGEQAREEAEKQLKQAESTKKEAVAAQQSAEGEVKEAKEKFDAANKNATQAKEAADQDPQNEALMEAAETAVKADSEAGARAQAAKKAKATADKAVAEADANQKAVVKARDNANQIVSNAQVMAKAAEAAREGFEGLKNAAPAQPAKIKVSLPAGLFRLLNTAPIVLEVAAAATPLKQGGQMQIPVHIKRIFGFADQVILRVVAPEDIKGIHLVGDEVKIAKDQVQGNLMIAAANDAAPGELTLTIKARVRVDDQDLDLDRTLHITIEGSNGE